MDHDRLQPHLQRPLRLHGVLRVRASPEGELAHHVRDGGREAARRNELDGESGKSYDSESRRRASPGIKRRHARARGQLVATSRKQTASSSETRLSSTPLAIRFGIA
mgnify:CR=1 FL=1